MAHSRNRPSGVTARGHGCAPPVSRVPSTDNEPEASKDSAVTAPVAVSFTAYSTGNDGWRTSHEGHSSGSEATSVSDPDGDRENVVTPVVNYAVSRPDVDTSRMGLMGISMGGYMVPRAATKEHRLKVIIAAYTIISIINMSRWAAYHPSRCNIGLRQLVLMASCAIGNTRD